MVLVQQLDLNPMSLSTVHVASQRSGYHVILSKRQTHFSGPVTILNSSSVALCFQMSNSFALLRLLRRGAI